MIGLARSVSIPLGTCWRAALIINGHPIDRRFSKEYEPCSGQQ
ncbi:hypothetical protein ADIMK_3757 [Marinobacterium lacunae]|uniref:Uncharacterized protein n=1 Tax=Marinobacterium lacunae TaxID=1232683 RepID=A0A081FU91_9GAMM|nr:hypothetical protein ADIMK_3757 [Marinobacterium lacunae]